MAGLEKLQGRATRAVHRIMVDMMDRSGIGNALDSLDAATRSELEETWRNIIVKAFVEED